MPIAFVQSTSQGVNSTVKSVTVGFASANTAGNLLVAGCGCASTNPPTTVTDSAGNTWTRAQASTDNSLLLLHEVWHVLNCVGSTNSVTYSYTSGGVAGVRTFIGVAEYSGLSKTLGTDTGAFSTGGPSTQVVTGTFQTTIADELLFAEARIQGSTATWSTLGGYDNLISNSTTLRAIAGRIVSAIASTYRGSFSIDGTTSAWGVICRAYQTDPVGGGTWHSFLLTGVQ